MTYNAEISRERPGAILFLIDQSGSMSDPFGGEPGRSKAERLADAVNRLLFELTIRCTRDQEEGVRNYYEVGVIGYGKEVGPVLGGALRGRTLVSIRDIANNPLRIDERQVQREDGAGGLVREIVRLPVWFDPMTAGGTPMCQALRLACSVLDPWIQTHANSYPPIVINITDGEATDGDPRQPGQVLSQMATQDGSTLLFNLHLSSRPGQPLLYPESEVGLPDEYARQLFQMSSLLPPVIQQATQSEGYHSGPQSRGFVFNADIVEVIKFLDIGTRAKLR